MNFFLIGVCMVIGLIVALIVTVLCFLKARTGLKVFDGIISVVICCVLCGVLGFTLSLKKVAEPLIFDNSAKICEQIETSYPGILDEQYNVEDITGILDKIDLKGQLDSATADLGKLEKVVVMTALRSFTPLLYSSETLSGALQGLITHDMRDSGTLSLNQVVDVLEGKALSVLQKTISVIQIAVLVLFVLYLIVSIVIGYFYSSSKKRTSKGISYGENIDG